MLVILTFSSAFFFTATATTDIYTLSLHDALPILLLRRRQTSLHRGDVLHLLPRGRGFRPDGAGGSHQDRKSTRLNSSHQIISYAVFCLKKKKKLIKQNIL